MEDLLIKNGILITMDKERRVFQKGALAIKGSRIVDLGENDEIVSRYQAARVIDAEQKLVMPGFIDAHVHSQQTLARGLADDIDVWTWIYKKIWPYESIMTEEEAYYSALLSCIEMIRSGTTCYAEACAQHATAVGNAMLDTGIRAVLVKSTTDIPGSELKPSPGATDKAVQGNADTITLWKHKGNGRIKPACGLRVIPNCSDDLIREIGELACKEKVGIIAHIVFSEDEDERVRRRSGYGEIELLDHLGVLGPWFLGIHSIYLRDQDLRLFKDKDVKVCHCAYPSAHLAAGAAVKGSFLEMVRLGITVALGCDGAPANNSLDMIQEMKYAASIQKEIKRDPTVFPAELVLEMATINGARALLWNDEIGSLDIGKKADIIIVDLNRAHLIPLHDPISNLVYSGKGSDVSSVIIDGRLVMHQGELLTVKNEQEILHRCQEFAQDIVNRGDIQVEARWSQRTS